MDNLMKHECVICYRDIDDNEWCVPMAQLVWHNSEPVKIGYAHAWHFQQKDTDDDD